MESTANLLGLTALALALTPIAIHLASKVLRPGVRIPFTATRMTRFCPEDPHEMAGALEDFIEEWQSRFGPNPAIREALRRLDIHWIPKPAFYVWGRKAAGVVESKRRVRVAAPPGIPLGQTAFFHLLVHLMLWHLEGDPDPDHPTDAWAGWNPEHTEMVAELNQRWKGGGLPGRGSGFPFATLIQGEFDSNRCASCR